MTSMKVRASAGSRVTNAHRSQAASQDPPWWSAYENLRSAVADPIVPIVRQALALVLEWAAIHRAELRTNWEAARRGAAPLPIVPLD
jgi:hypothetical protein